MASAWYRLAGRIVADLDTELFRLSYQPLFGHPPTDDANPWPPLIQHRVIGQLRAYSEVETNRCPTPRRPRRSLRMTLANIEKMAYREVVTAPLLYRNHSADNVHIRGRARRGEHAMNAVSPADRHDRFTV